MSVLPDAGKNIEHLSPLRCGVLDAIGSEKRYSIGPGQLNQLFVSLIFVAHQMPLNFDEDIITTERINQELCAICKNLAGAIDPNRPRTTYRPGRAGDSVNRPYLRCALAA